MDYETEEQQVEALKSWWTENGRAVIAGALLGGGVIGGWALWQGHVENKTLAASESFSRAVEALDADDLDTAMTLAQEAQDDNPNHLYASYAAFTAARAAVEKNDLTEAAARLQWVVDNAPQHDVELIARVRLARVEGASGDAAKGLETLPDSFPDAFMGLVEEARGDLNVITGDLEAARAAYQLASESEFIANREGLTMKLNELATSEDATDDSSESAS